jgi:DNA-binding NarL/FixJ family response regulator
MSEDSINILLVDDQRIIRDGLRSLLETKPDLNILGDVENGIMVMDFLQTTTLMPDVILMDIRMPIMDGIATTKKISQEFPDIKVLILTTFDDQEYVSQAMHWGARGYLLKDSPSEDIANAIRAVHRGYTQMSPGIFEKAISQEKKPLEIPPEITNLTAREQEVLKLIIKGSSNREIAEELYISERTVKNHITSILSQLQLRDRTQVVIFASQYLQDQ